MENDSINIFLDSVCNGIKCSQAKEDIRQELYGHILEEKSYNIERGIKNEEAELMAIKKMGEPEKISKEFNKIYKKKLDWKLLIIALILTLVDILLITTMAKNIDESTPYIIRNIVYISIGIIMAILFYFIDYRKIQKFSLRYRNVRSYLYVDRYIFI